MGKLERVTYGEIYEIVPLRDVIPEGRGSIEGVFLHPNQCNIVTPTGKIRVRSDSKLSRLSTDEFFRKIDPELKKNKLYFKVEDYDKPGVFSSRRFVGRFYKERKHI
jgi:hypothetical protein